MKHRLSKGYRTHGKLWTLFFIGNFGHLFLLQASTGRLYPLLDPSLSKYFKPRKNISVQRFSFDNFDLNTNSLSVTSVVIRVLFGWSFWLVRWSNRSTKSWTVLLYRLNCALSKTDPAFCWMGTRFGKSNGSISSRKKGVVYFQRKPLKRTFLPSTYVQIVLTEEYYQCDQIGRFIGLCATFWSLWQQLIWPNLPHS